MILKDKKVKISEIFLDPYNPRFITQENCSQETILHKILDSKDAKELLNSMKINIKWVNKIVVIKKEDFSEKQKDINNISNANYLVVEGNNRLSCLKSGKIPDITDDHEIPVIVAEKEVDETSEEFESQQRVTQGIANVMVVKEWSTISKARHLHQMYHDFLSKEPHIENTPHEIYKRIAEELGIGTAEVRQSIIRFEFYSKINSISDKIPEDHWGYLEAFDRNKNIRTKFGMSAESNTINLNDEESDDYIEEILKDIPCLIKKAASEGINTKQFRDIINNEISEINSPDDLSDFIQSIIDTDSDYNFKNKLIQNNQLTEKEKWAKQFVEIKKQIEVFPNMSSWAPEYKDDLESLKSLIGKHLKILSDD